VLLPVTRLRPHVRRELSVPDDHLVLSRPAGRARSVTLDPEAAGFVATLRRPTRLAEAIRGYAVSQDADPAAMIRSVYPLLDKLRSSGLLVRPDAARPMRFRLAPGDRLAEWTITRGVQVLEESEVYAARDREGRRAAVKVARRAGDTAVAAVLRHEGDVLSRLGEVASVPAMRAGGDAGGHAFLALEWRDGVDALAAARPLRSTPGAAAALGARIAQAYAQLHARGVLHADVHPKNVLVAEDGSVSLLDFGLARVIPDGPGPARRGIGFFYEPELARALLRRVSLPPATPAGEVYALSALLYLLIVGDHYCDFPLQREAFLAAVAEREPLPWAVRGRDPWPQVEAALAAGLAKAPERRPSAAELAQRLTAAAASAPPSPAAVAEEAPFGYLDPVPLPHPPRASVHYGSAGLAWALLRVAQTRSRADLLASAELWSRRPVGPEEAFFAPDIGISRDSVGADSLHHGAFGAAVVRCLVAHAAWDVPGMRSATAGLIAAAAKQYDRLDLVSGLAGVLLGLALVAEALPDDPLLDRAGLLSAGHAVAGRLESAGGDSGRLGLAHGRAGCWNAQLRWAESAGCLPPPSLPSRLERLAGEAQPAGGGLAWPTDRGGPAASNRLAAGWCRGAAGFTLLFLAADRSHPSAGFGPTALAAAETAWVADEPAWNLCCGVAGRAYALLAVVAHTGDELWRDRARALAAGIASPADLPAAPAASLYKGSLGVHILRSDLWADPLGAAFPLCEPAGWARRTWTPR